MDDRELRTSTAITYVDTGLTEKKYPLVIKSAVKAINICFLLWLDPFILFISCWKSWVFSDWLESWKVNSWKFLSFLLWDEYAIYHYYSNDNFLTPAVLPFSFFSLFFNFSGKNSWEYLKSDIYSQSSLKIIIFQFLYISHNDLRKSLWDTNITCMSIITGTSDDGKIIHPDPWRQYFSLVFLRYYINWKFKAAELTL